MQADVTNPGDCESIVSTALTTFNRLDILVNNVGISGAAGTAVDVDMEEWAKSLEVNVSSMVFVSKYAIPAMMQNERDEYSGMRGKGNGWDCATAVVFLAGPHARWMTGVILPVDAGTTAAVGIGMPKSASVNG
ncbi:unnamed protein product [Aspergillus oryzae var. brunneus]|nr:unnamed protein product [Aspergillus oryzae var. brunneus]